MDLSTALRRPLGELTFRDNSFNDEGFFAESIRDGFAGWYDEGTVRRQVDFVLTQSGLTRPSSVLDAGCGHGRHAQLIHARGHSVTATDISEALVNYLSRTHSGICFRRVSFTEIDYREEFDLVLVLGNGLALIPREDLLVALHRLSESMKPTGVLFVQFDNLPYFVRNEAGRKTWSFHAGRWLVLSEHLYDPKTKLEKTIDTTIDTRDISTSQFLLTKSLYGVEELLRYFGDSGLAVDKVLGDWIGGPLDEESPTTILVARRAA